AVSTCARPARPDRPAPPVLSTVVLTVRCCKKCSGVVPGCRADDRSEPMKYALEYPSEQPAAPDDFLRPDVIRDVVGRAEEAGFAAVALSEHPAPSRKWRDNGGHNTLDPIAALGFMAGVTSSIRLMTNLYVLPFRNPYLSAKALASLDIVSGGRLIAGV